MSKSGNKSHFPFSNHNIFWDVRVYADFEHSTREVLDRVFKLNQKIKSIEPESNLSRIGSCESVWLIGLDQNESILI